MAFTPAPTPPNSGDPANFNPQADAFLGWMAIFADELNIELPFISSKTWATRSGTANAITLTAGFKSLAAGMQVRFRAGAANTGVTTINLDGLGARPCRTITGLALPAGYIRTDTDTVATYNGTDWIVDRQVERGSNTNGEYTRLADGTQICACTAITLTTGAVGAAFPAAFAPAAPRTSTAIRLSSTIPLSAVITALSTTGATVSAYLASGQRVAAAVDILAFGRWY